jgi:hypothetical protein
MVSAELYHYIRDFIRSSDSLLFNIRQKKQEGTTKLPEKLLAVEKSILACRRELCELVLNSKNQEEQKD